MPDEEKPLFFAMDVKAPWLQGLPEGRLLREEDRHLTLAFLGKRGLGEVLLSLSQFPKPSFSIGLAALFSAPLFLPQRSPRVAAWQVQLLEEEEPFFSFQKQLISWLREEGFSLSKEREEFLPHVTVARRPFSIAAWKRAFAKSPLFFSAISLFQSLGSSRYERCWTYPLLPPFEEREHTADLAFLIRGENFSQLFLHARLALSFHFPLFLWYPFLQPEVDSLEEVVFALNRLISWIDAEEGCPLKAVSYHGVLERQHNLEWEMIVDV